MCDHEVDRYRTRLLSYAPSAAPCTHTCAYTIRTCARIRLRTFANPYNQCCSLRNILHDIVQVHMLAESTLPTVIDSLHYLGLITSDSMSHIVM